MMENQIVQNIYRNTISLFDGKVTIPATPYEATLPITIHIDKPADQSQGMAKITPSSPTPTHNHTAVKETYAFQQRLPTPTPTHPTAHSHLPLISLKAKKIIMHGESIQVPIELPDQA